MGTRLDSIPAHVSYCAILFVVTTVAVYSLVAASRQTPKKPTDSSLTREVNLRSFLQDYGKRDFDKTARYVHAFVDLDGDGYDEAIAYIVGRSVCGSGGCNLLVLKSDGSSYRVVSKTTITNPPIRLLSNSSHGWRSIGIWMKGGGNLEGYEVELRFDGKAYPSNPNLAPRLAEKVPGNIIIPLMKSYTDAEPLYPEPSAK
jgi:hypothetical protein